MAGLAALIPLKLVFAFQGYRQKDSYIASQGPLQHTLEDFWRMIWEWKSCSIVMLTELEERGQVSSWDGVGGIARQNSLEEGHYQLGQMMQKSLDQWSDEAASRVFVLTFQPARK